jgi:hypothetical protein
VINGKANDKYAEGPGADALADALMAIKAFLEWGAMTGSDKELFRDKFQKDSTKCEN